MTEVSVSAEAGGLGLDLIQDEDEIIRWFAAGQDTTWMCQEYERRYNIALTPALFSRFQEETRPPCRREDDPALIPWDVRTEHECARPLAMLRVEGWLRAGEHVGAEDRRRLEAWRSSLVQAGLVVDYDADTVEGFHYVPRRPDVDLDLIREPEPAEAPTDGEAPPAP
jgi:hypothetical protein